MPEITLQQTGADDVKELVPMTNMIDEMLPNADSKLKTKLRIKIYNLSRTRNWPWVTVKRRRYYKPETAKIIIGSVSDYAEAIKNETTESENKTAKAKSKAKVKKAKPVGAAKIIAQATKNAELSKDTKEKLHQRIAYIAKTNLFKPVKGRTIYSAENAKQIISELASYYQQLQHDIHLAKTSKSKSENKQGNNIRKQNERGNRQANRENNNRTTKHPFEIKNNRNNYRRNYNNNYNNKRQNYVNNSGLQERYDNLLRNYTQLQERYDKVLNEKNNLINEKANQLDSRFNNLKSVLLEILKRS